jgi:hypothetical protein
MLRSHQMKGFKFRRQAPIGHTLPTLCATSPVDRGNRRRPEEPSTSSRPAHPSMQKAEIFDQPIRPGAPSGPPQPRRSVTSILQRSDISIWWRHICKRNIEMTPSANLT